MGALSAFDIPLGHCHEHFNECVQEIEAMCAGESGQCVGAEFGKIHKNSHKIHFGCTYSNYTIRAPNARSYVHVYHFILFEVIIFWN